MNELSRLFDAERAEMPPPGRTARGLDALGAALDAGVPSMAVARGPLKLGLSLATKSMLGSGLVAFAATTGGLSLHAATQGSPEPATRAAAGPALGSTRAPSAPPLSSNAAAAAEPRASATAPARAAEAPRAPAAAPHKDAASTFSDELRLIKAAKLELDGNRSHLARIWLDQHARLYPNGVFSRERETLIGRLGSGGRASFETEAHEK